MHSVQYSSSKRIFDTVMLKKDFYLLWFWVKRIDILATGIKKIKCIILISSEINVASPSLNFLPRAVLKSAPPPLG